MKNAHKIMLGIIVASAMAALAGCSAPAPEAAATPASSAASGTAPAPAGEAAPGAPKGVPEVKPGMAGVPASR